MSSSSSTIVNQLILSEPSVKDISAENDAGFLPKTAVEPTSDATNNTAGIQTEEQADEQEPNSDRTLILFSEPSSTSVSSSVGSNSQPSQAPELLCGSCLEENSRDAFPPHPTQSEPEEAPPVAYQPKLTLKIIRSLPSVAALASPEVESTEIVSGSVDNQSSATGASTATGTTATSESNEDPDLEDESHPKLVIAAEEPVTRNVASTSKSRRNKESTVRKPKLRPEADVLVSDDEGQELLEKGTEINGFIYDLDQATDASQVVVHSRRPPRQAALNNKYIRTRVIHERVSHDEEVAPPLKRQKTSPKRLPPDDPRVKLKKVKAAIANTSVAKSSRGRGSSSAQGRLQKKLGLGKRA